MIELWKDIKNYEGIYQVSSFGNVKSFKNNKIKILIPKNRTKPKLYGIVDLRKNNVKKSFYIHQLVAMTFLNHIPDRNKISIDHINNNKKDNRLINLQILTVRGNNSKEQRGLSKYRGVSFYKNTEKWRSQIFIEGKLKHLGYFNSELEAHNMYKEMLDNIPVTAKINN